MWAKIVDGAVSKYPYSLSDLQKDFPNVSFPMPLGASVLKDYGVVEVAKTDVPNVSYTQNVTEGAPQLDGSTWRQTWVVQYKPAEEITALAEQHRRNAYTVEADPIFFKWQRGEATQQEWLAKIAEIKAKYPD